MNARPSAAHLVAITFSVLAALASGPAAGQAPTPGQAQDAGACLHAGGLVGCPNNPGTGVPLPPGSQSLFFETQGGISGSNWMIFNGGGIFIPSTTFPPFVAPIVPPPVVITPGPPAPTPSPMPTPVPTPPPVVTPATPGTSPPIITFQVAPFTPAAPTSPTRTPPNVRPDTSFLPVPQFGVSPFGSDVPAIFGEGTQNFSGPGRNDIGLALSDPLLPPPFSGGDRPAGKPPFTASPFTGPDTAGPGSPVFIGQQSSEAVLDNLLGRFDPFDAQFGGGVRVAVGDPSGTGKDEIIVGGAGPSPAGKPSASPGAASGFFAFDDAFRGGVFVSGFDPGGNAYSGFQILPPAAGTPIVPGSGGGPGNDGPIVVFIPSELALDGSGGGILSGGPPITLENATIRGNTAGKPPGPSGGGILAGGPPITLENTTIRDNTAGKPTAPPAGSGASREDEGATFVQDQTQSIVRRLTTGTPDERAKAKKNLDDFGSPELKQAVDRIIENTRKMAIAATQGDAAVSQIPGPKFLKSRP